jgi:hypothetical protein
MLLRKLAALDSHFDISVKRSIVFSSQYSRQMFFLVSILFICVLTGTVSFTILVLLSGWFVLN